MKRFYRVATHGFSVSLPEFHPLWQLMGNYAPFETEENDAGGFSLSLEKETVQLQGKGTFPVAPGRIALAPEQEAFPTLDRHVLIDIELLFRKHSILRDHKWDRAWICC